MRVRFLKDFRSAHTREEFYQAGEEAELADPSALALIAEGAAAPLPPPPPPPPAAPPSPAQPPRQKGRRP